MEHDQVARYSMRFSIEAFWRRTDGGAPECYATRSLCVDVEDEPSGEMGVGIADMAQAAEAAYPDAYALEILATAVILSHRHANVQDDEAFCRAAQDYLAKVRETCE